MTAVALLAAGSGTRLGQKTAYFNKALLRVGDYAIISRIIDYFPPEFKIVVAIGYLGDIVQQYLKMAHPDRNFVFVKTEKFGGPGAGPGYALNECRKHLQEPFYIWTSDTLLEDGFDPEYDEDENWVGYKLVSMDERSNYCTFDRNDVGDMWQIWDKSKAWNAPRQAFIGCARVGNYESFWRQFEFLWEQQDPNKEHQLVDALFTFDDCKNIKAIPFEGWIDTGHELGLMKARETWKARIENLDKVDEELYFVGNRVIKYFYHPELVKNRILRAQKMNGSTPRIVDYSNNFYSYEYLEGTDFFNVEDPVPHMKYILSEAHNRLWSQSGIPADQYDNFKLVCEKFYKQKTHARLKDYYFKTKTEDRWEIINGVEVGPLGSLLNKVDWKDLSEGRPSVIHGDFNFSNILLTNDSHYKFIDWRQDFGGLLDYGDTYYDFAKMYSGLVFPHDIVKQHKFSINITDNEGVRNVDFQMNRPKKYLECEKIFFDWVDLLGYDVKKVRILGAIVLLNMSPLHESPLDVYLYYQGKELLFQNVN